MSSRAQTTPDERIEQLDGWRFDDAEIAAVRHVIEARRDIRRFRPDPVPEDVLERVLTAAHLAPSVGYMQPTRFILVTSQEMRVAVRAIADRERMRQSPQFDERARHFLELKVEGIVEAPIGICVCCDRGSEDDVVLGRGTIRDTDLYSTACAIQNLWLMARAEGLGVGWVSFYQPPDLRELLGIPERVVPVAYLCVGYPGERPVRPGFEISGWGARRPLGEMVYRERWEEETEPATASEPGRSARAGTPAMPPAVRELARAVSPADPAAMIAARDHAVKLIKPAGSLGALDILTERWAAAAGSPPPEQLRSAVLVCAADHGVAGREPTLDGKTAATLVAAAARGESAIGVLSKARGDRLVVADVGLRDPTPPGVVDRKIARGTADLVGGPAMTAAELEHALLSGSELARDALEDMHCLVCGEIGHGDTTAAAAVLAGLMGVPAEQVCDREPGVDPARLQRKLEAIRSALATHEPSPDDPLEVLRCLGGFEIAALAGAILTAAARRRPVVLDGFTVGVAALVAARLAVSAREYMFAASRSPEVAHGLVLSELGLEPLLDLRLRLGEASAAAIALPLIEAAGRLHGRMGTFASSGVGPAERRPG